VNANLLHLLAILIGINAIALWYGFWRFLRDKRQLSSPVLVAVEVAGYILVAGLVIRIL
jgi:uncharacterized membrane protein YidH (DUF202 family)